MVSDNIGLGIVVPAVFSTFHFYFILFLSLSIKLFLLQSSSLFTFPCLIFLHVVSNPNKPLLGACAQDKSKLIDIWFPQDELDKANKDKKHFPPGFKVIYQTRQMQGIVG